MAVRTKGNAPVKKVAASGIGGAIATIVVFVLNTYVITDPSKLLTGDVSAALTTFVSFLTAYIVPPGAKESNIQSN